ncbi:ubiquinone biosynthesis accessory factor UbiJ [Permianibacter aggregans]|uniref:Ubiquinone biosynthesis accessory factor UbiJ n=1 Tax=Permianibacter aggregans TaxID=1510150 RepID=A0A4R6UPD7_9GAMM|nr:SCP2 sterol-binding domain-containing protein [Permianibacter aggregans]QGX40107.1 hypothetical protein E2H98_10675 [Permianibacter aggregans]TDQ49078.1 ubiquinone biosynthesis protein UbiJ [Permianibacter aggregans]
MLPVLLLAMLEAPVNRLIALDPLAPPKLKALEGKPLAVELTGLQWRLLLSVDAGCLRFASEGQAAVTLSGRLVDFAQVASQGGDMAAGTLQVTGDVGAAQRWQRFFTELQPDFDEQLAQWIGDLPAHQLGQLFRQIGEALRQLLLQSQSASVEFLQEEGRWLVARAEMQQFLDEVDALRARADTLLNQARKQGVG